MAVYLSAISVSPSYPHITNYPISANLPSNVAVLKRRYFTTVQLQCLGFQFGCDVEQHTQESKIHWDNFYHRHQNKFFKDRHYLEKDWGPYFCDDNPAIRSNRKIILEAGCGTGNTIFPLAKTYPKLYVHACDFSHHAVTLVKANPKFREDQMNIFVCNIVEDNLCNHIQPASVDVVTLIFTLSAVSPEKMPIVVENIGRVLKPNGHVLIRDYAIGDYSQLMLMNKNQVISENFYFRGDGTTSFYFSEDHLSNLFIRSEFGVVDIDTYNKELKNRARNITMNRN
ncbi:tRNA N(3)-methylcytidine methyltransferase trm141-like isoform X2 [Rutidosis leptorrhynchoides]|uniref:tRNA N(3)-methylcytidine methyltransferase trm141-like isoform X2 n=1 Tax=Rutidosis leptorrhynchoides TaxID=125765 RepID=UPI003A9947E8